VILAELFRKISFVEINFDKFFRCRVAIVVKSASITKINAKNPKKAEK